LTNKGLGVIIISTKEIKRKGGSNPVDNVELTTQYVSGMANVMTCEESLYHRL